MTLNDINQATAVEVLMLFIIYIILIEMKKIREKCCWDEPGPFLNN